jgi:DNA modification methylase
MTTQITDKVLFQLGNGLVLLDAIPKESQDCIYLDPPFDSDRNYSVSVENTVGFNDKWTGDEYEIFIKALITKSAEKLKKKGTLFFHISSDRMFIPERILRETFKFVQPIFWKRCRSKNNVKSKLGATIDIIFKCNRETGAKFNLVLQPKDEKYLECSFKNQDERGNYAMGHLVTESTKKGYMYEFVFDGRTYKPESGWRIKQEELEALKQDNRLHIPKTRGSKLYKKIYLHENPGKPCTDLWDDIHSIGQGNEIRKYPTAKPEKLLERIVRISTNEGDSVLDPTCGSGTTGVVCARLGRKCIMMDSNPDVLSIIQSRFETETTN